MSPLADDEELRGKISFIFLVMFWYRVGTRRRWLEYRDAEPCDVRLQWPVRSVIPAPLYNIAIHQTLRILL